MIDFDNDLIHMLDFQDFGIEATLQNGEKVLTVFDNLPVTLDNGMTVISTSQPTLTCRTVDTKSIVQNDKIIFKDTEWTVIDIKHDGTGVTELLIKK